MHVRCSGRRKVPWSAIVDHLRMLVHGSYAGWSYRDELDLHTVQAKLVTKNFLGACVTFWSIFSYYDIRGVKNPPRLFPLKF